MTKLYNNNENTLKENEKNYPIEERVGKENTKSMLFYLFPSKTRKVDQNFNFDVCNIERVLKISNSIKQFIFLYSAQNLRDVTRQNNQLQRKDIFSANGCRQNNLLKITSEKTSSYFINIPTASAIYKYFMVKSSAANFTHFIFFNRQQHLCFHWSTQNFTINKIQLGTRIKSLKR